jgi:site-specific DNA-methyltransferase (adenine-specific)
MNKIIQGDCMQELKKLKNDSIDLTVTSPPYDNLRKYNSYTFNFEEIAKELYRVTKNGGIIAWLIGDATIKGSETGTSFKQALYFKEIGFNLHDTMIYKKINPIPLTHNRYEQAFEFMLILSKGRPKTFNPILEKCKTNGTYTNRRKTGRVIESATRNRNEITKTKDIKYKTNIWEYVIGGKKEEGINHPAPFPEKLVEDHIISWSNKGDIVLDPMAGSGTTLKMAKKNNRNFIGIEISKEYCEMAKKRLKLLKTRE